jgi:hypothetical protein
LGDWIAPFENVTQPRVDDLKVELSFGLPRLPKASGIFKSFDLRVLGWPQWAIQLNKSLGGCGPSSVIGIAKDGTSRLLTLLYRRDPHSSP